MVEIFAKLQCYCIAASFCYVSCVLTIEEQERKGNVGIDSFPSVLCLRNSATTVQKIAPFRSTSPSTRPSGSSVVTVKLGCTYLRSQASTVFFSVSWQCQGTICFYRMLPYAGQPDEIEAAESGKPRDLVMKLIAGLEGSGRNVTMDRY